MKKIKLASIFLTAVLMLSFTGCGRIIAIINSKAIAEAEAIPRVAFSRELLSETSDEIIITAEELCSTELMVDDYRSNFHYLQLSDGEQTAYTALEYALEKGYRYIYIDDLLVADGSMLERVLEFLSMDSPLVEQNYSFSSGTFTMYYDVRLSQAELSGFYICVENFTDANLVKKQAALDKAKEIVAAMPEGLSEIEKARYLFKYTVENVKYYNYDNNYDVDKNMSLYDGLITGKTHCDGSTNMYGLLLNIAGIECFEKVYSDPNAEGHTWNFLKLGKGWYNADATAPEDSESLKEETYNLRYFGFADIMQRYSADYSELYPKADECIDYKINAHLSEINKSTFVKTVNAGFDANGKRLAVLIVDSYNDKTMGSAMQRLANSFGGRVYWIHYEIKDGGEVVFVTA